MQISKADSLPKFVCQMCWKTTELFHELYEKSKMAHKTFLNSIIKCETVSIAVYPQSNDRDDTDEQPLDYDDIKLEANLGKKKPIRSEF